MDFLANLDLSLMLYFSIICCYGAFILGYAMCREEYDNSVVCVSGKEEVNDSPISSPLTLIEENKKEETKMLEPIDFKNIYVLVNKASTEQLYVLQQLIGAVIQDKINSAALASGLASEAEPEKLPIPNNDGQ